MLRMKTTTKKPSETSPELYNRDRVWRMDQFAHKPDDRSVLSHWLQNRNTSSAEPYEKKAKALLTGEVLLWLSSEGRVLRESLEQTILFPDVFDIPFPPPSTPHFTFIDLFAGIGGIRLGFQSLGGKCVFSSEWNPSAAQTYEANFGEHPFGDITKIHVGAIPDSDILLAGFPCQPFSIIGDRKGFEHETHCKGNFRRINEHVTKSYG